MEKLEDRVERLENTMSGGCVLFVVIVLLCLISDAVTRKFQQLESRVEALELKAEAPK